MVFITISIITNRSRLSRSKFEQLNETARLGFKSYSFICIMNKSTKTTILIGGSSHAGKSTLGKFLAAKLGWSYLATDSLARHPGRPWTTKKGKPVSEHVIEHYQTLSVEELLADVLFHYKTNVLPQVKTLVDSGMSGGIIVEGSALYPEYVANLVEGNSVRGIWLTASDRLFQNRIYSESNFNNADREQKYLIQKFLNRTLLYNERMKQGVKRLGFIGVNVEATTTIDELSSQCLKLDKYFLDS